VPDPTPEPIEALKFLANKKVLPTESWKDLKCGEHSHVFTVAHSAGAGVADDIFGLMKKAEEEGKSINNFGKELRGLMDAKGWYGRSDKGPNDKDYINFRIRAIYHTNMRTSYSAGKYRQQVRSSSLRPIWQYLSKMVGDHRRPEHQALHEKAFRWDDPFWNANYPPNGWGCECSVVSLSERSAQEENVTVLHSRWDGTPPHLKGNDGKLIDWNKFAPAEWRYNPGKEALIPSFSKYKFECLKEEPEKKAAMLDAIEKRYRDEMENCKLTFGELMAIAGEMAIRHPSKEEGDPKNNPIMYLVGNIEDKNKIEKMGIGVGNVMICGQKIYHGFVVKNPDQDVPEKHLQDIYDMMQDPPEVYRINNTEEDEKEFGVEYHFVKKLDKKYVKILNIVLRKMENVALEIKTIGLIGGLHLKKYPEKFRKII
jgi:SPP1 gp7 family putative phage head morphogenesis protein